MIFVLYILLNNLCLDIYKNREELQRVLNNTEKYKNMKILDYDELDILRVSSQKDIHCMDSLKNGILIVEGKLLCTETKINLDFMRSIV